MPDEKHVIPILHLQENIDYQLIPNENDENWSIRILEGYYAETIIRFDTIRLNENETLSFNFNVVFSPDPDVNEKDTTLQNYVGSVLYSVLESLEKADNGR